MLMAYCRVTSLGDMVLHPFLPDLDKEVLKVESETLKLNSEILKLKPEILKAGVEGLETEAWDVEIGVRVAEK